MIRNPRFLAANLAALFFLSSSLSAVEGTLESTVSEPIRFSASTHLIYSNSKDANDRSAKPANTIMHEGKVRTEYSKYSLGVGFTNRFFIEKNVGENKPFAIEKKTATADWGNFYVELGDSYQELGKGIALSLYRDPVFGIDTTVEGASVRFRPKGLDATAFGGRLNAWKSPVAINAQENPLARRDVWLAATSAKVDVTEGTKMGGHYFYAGNRPENSTRFDKVWHTVGTTLSQEITDELDFYGEGNMLVPRSNENQAIEYPKGFGSYGALTYSPAMWKVRLEGKDFRSYRFDFRRPPTLEEDVVETINTQDVSSIKIYSEHKMDTRNSLFGSYLYGEDRLTSTKVPVHHGVIGTKLGLPEKIDLELKGGYRTMAGNSNLFHAGVKGKMPTFKGQSMDLGVRKQIANTNLGFLPTKNDRNIFDLGYSFSESLALAMGYEYVPTNTGEATQNFANVTATYKTGAFIGKAFAGQTSGGTLCSGGVCRQVPPFTGAYLETTYSF